MQAKTGIDVRKFDRFVIGANIKHEAVKDYDLDPVVLARGTMNAGSLIAGAKLGQMPAIVKRNLASERSISLPQRALPTRICRRRLARRDAAANHVPAEMAVATLDANTLVFGSPARVRETLEARTTVAPEITSLLSPRAASVFTFAARVPAGVRDMLPMDNDELGKNIESIKFLYGWTDITAAGASMNVTARTTNGESAQSLYDTVAFLQQLGKGMLGSSKKPENAVYARLDR